VGLNVVVDTGGVDGLVFVAEDVGCPWWMVSTIVM